MFSNDETKGTGQGSLDKDSLQKLFAERSKIDEKAWKLIEKLTLAQVRHMRWAMIGKGVFRTIMLVLVVMLAFGIPQKKFQPGFKSEGQGPHVAVVSLKGLIAEGSPAGATSTNRALKAAFENKFSKAVVLRIHSPGGSPVQADLIHKHILALRAKHPEKPIYAVIGDIGTSGAYYVAAATDKIFANPSSIVGSIGVIHEGFGFQNLLNSLGIERRLVVSGENKALLDPFSATADQAAKHMKLLVQEVHEEFITAVKQGRQDKLNGQQMEEIFSGLAWTGKQGMKLGLIDGFYSLDELKTEVIGVDRAVDYTPQPSALDRLTNQFSRSIIDNLMQSSMPALRY